MSVKSPNSNTKKQLTIQSWLIDRFAQQLSLKRNQIKADEPLTRYGLDSIDAVTMVGDLEDLLDLELPSTLFWDYPTIEQAAQYLAQLDLPEMALLMVDC
jgi:acyl carrier protein